MQGIKNHPIAAFFGFAFLFSWFITLFMIARYNDVLDVPGWLHYVVAWGPAAAAFMIEAITNGRLGIVALLRRIFHWRIGWFGWLLAIGSPLAIFAIAALVSTFVNDTAPDFGAIGEVDYLGSIGIPAAILVWILSFGIGEEIGWRGFAQHYLQPQRGFLFTTVMIGLIWALWHIPHFFYKDTFIEMGLAGFPFYVINIVPGAIVLGWLYHRTQSVLAVGIWHGLFDTFTAASIDDGMVAIVMSALVMTWALVIVVDVFRSAPKRAPEGATL